MGDKRVSVTGRHPTFVAIDQALEDVRFLQRAEQSAFMEATGFAVDDPDNVEDPMVFAMWKRNRLAYFHVDQAVVKYYQQAGMPRPGDNAKRSAERKRMALMEFTTLVNEIILAARNDWQADFASRLPGA